MTRPEPLYPCPCGGRFELLSRSDEGLLYKCLGCSRRASPAYDLVTDRDELVCGPKAPQAEKPVPRRKQQRRRKAAASKGGE